MKKHSLYDILILRASFNPVLNNAILNGESEKVKVFIGCYDGEDRDFYNFDEEIDMQELKKRLEESNAEVNAAFKSGRKIFGF